MTPAADTSLERRLRVLILSAPVGESHSEMARVLAGELQTRDDVDCVSILDGFFVLGPTLEWILGRGFAYHLGRVGWSYNLAYRMFTKLGLARSAGEWALSALGGRALSATVRGHRPDVVVSTYPVMNPVLGRLRAAERIRCPVAAVVGPLGQHEFWVHPGLDLHLVLYEEALPSVNQLARGAPAVTIRPLVREAFFADRSRNEARRALALPDRRSVVVVSGGGWGAGDLLGAVDACLALADSYIIAVGGQNAPLRALLQSRYGSNPRVRVLGFTDRMPELLSAADAFVTATAGTSCIESRLCGCPVVVYGMAIGHVRDNARALVDHGLACMAVSPAELTSKLQGLLGDDRSRVRVHVRDDLPRAADLVASLASSSLEPPGAGGKVAGERYAAVQPWEESALRRRPLRAEPH